jgi:LacI family transcriptional regulator
MKKYTIKNIAELEGVSKGTVDRVLHNRGKVSEKVLEKVNAILNEIDYKPHLLTRSLKNTKEYHTCVILPDYNEDSFWLPCYEAIQKAIIEFTSFGVFTEPFFFKPTDVNSFIEINKKVLRILPNAVLIAPLFYKEIENTKNFVGQDLFKS